MKRIDYVKLKEISFKALSGLLALFVFLGENEHTLFSEKGESVSVDKNVRIIFDDRELEGKVVKIGKKYLELSGSKNEKIKVNIDKIVYVEEIECKKEE